jgi:hypothetical protein
VLASLAEPFEFFPPPPLTGLFVVGLAPHLFAQAASLTKLPEPADRFLDGLASTNP